MVHTEIGPALSCLVVSCRALSCSAQGRSVRVPRAVKGNRVARMTFDELCGSALGAADYTAISEAFHTLFVHGVPMMNLVHINQAGSSALFGIACMLEGETWL